MGSHVPLPHLWRSLGSAGLLNPDPFGPGAHPPPGAFPFDVLPPPEILEQKLASQFVEIQRLARENERFTATHSSLRHELAAAQQELHRLQNHMGAVKAEQEQEMRVLQDKIAKMEADLKGSDAVKVDLQKAHAEAQCLVTARQELLSTAQQLTQDLQRDHGEVQQIPSLISELEALRKEYRHFRGTYDCECKLRSDHFESLQLMENNYISMVKEVEKLRAELAKATNFDRREGGQVVTNAVHNESDAYGHHSAGQNVYEKVYGASEACRLSGGSAEYAGVTTGPASVRTRHDASEAPAHDASRSSNYSASGPGGYDTIRRGSYEEPGGTGNEASRVSGYDVSRVAMGAQGTAAAGNSVAACGSAQAPSSYEVAMAPGTFGSAQQQNYGAVLQPNYPTYGQHTYGSVQSPTYVLGQSLVYGSGQTPTYGMLQAPGYGLEQNQAFGSGKPPYHAGGDYGADH